MPGNAMGEVQDLSAPSGLGLAVLLDVFPAIRPTNHGTHGHDQSSESLVALIGRMRGSGIREGGKMLLKRRRHAQAHAAVSCWCKGRLGRQEPYHLTGKPSHFSNALTLGTQRFPSSAACGI